MISMLNTMKMQSMNLKMLCTIVCILLQLIYQGNANIMRVGEQRTEQDSPLYRCIGSIPEDLPANTTSVIIHDIATDTTISNLTFQGHGWQNVTSLQIMTNTSVEIVVEQHAFVRLHNLREIRLHLTALQMEINALSRIINLQVLDLSNTTLVEDYMLEDIIGTIDLTNLQQLLLAGVRSAGDNAIRLDSQLWKLAEEKQMKTIDISGMNIQTLDWSVFGHASRRNDMVFLFEWTHFKTVVLEVSGPLPVQDFTCKLHGRILIQTIKIVCSKVQPPIGQVMLYFGESFCFQDSRVSVIETSCVNKPFNFYIDNLDFEHGIQFLSISKKIWNIASLTIQNVYMKAINKTLFVGNVSLNSLLIKNVELEYINPKAIDRLSNITVISLSNNKLQVMNVKSPKSFQSLFSAFRQLREICLAGNGLKTLPPKIFLNNRQLEIIDLSGNKLIILSLDMNLKHQLKLLDVSENRLRNVDSNTMKWFDELIAARACNHTLSKCNNPFLKMHDNSFLCSSCSHFEFIEWMKSNKEHITRRSYITCSSLDKPRQNVFNVTLHECPTKANTLYIVGISIMSIILVLLSCICCILARKQYLQYLRRRKQRKVQDMFLQTLAAHKPRQYQYFVFLAYSSEDWAFVKHNVIGHLSEGLKAHIGGNIEPICTGDSNFRLGRHIQEEIITCIERSKVVLILLTNNYCRSTFCNDEFQRAVQLNKPVIIMVKDKVDEQLMTDGMRLYYKNNTRIIWSLENGEYVLKCTWGNVIDSIVDMAME